MSSADDAQKAERTSTPGLAMKRTALVVVALLVGVLLSEQMARITFNRRQGLLGHNPILLPIAQQAGQLAMFEMDPLLGYRLRGGALVGVYQTGFVSLGQIVSDKRRLGRVFVLNMGDSSTSGWDSNVMIPNRQRHRQGVPLKSPFQEYATYSDLLAKDSALYVVNAGVPAYSSLQGARYLDQLLASLTKTGVHVDVVTIYFGNNDCIWNGNIEDKYLLPGNAPSLHILRVLAQATKRWRVLTRADAGDYGERIDQMVRQSRKMGARVVLIEPVVAKMWPPGLPARGMEKEVDVHAGRLKSTRVGALLQQARDSFAQGMNAFRQGRNGQAVQRFHQAREADYLVPRIKDRYITALRTVARSEHVPLISVGDQIPLDDTGYFVDYCHPIEPANRLIASALSTAIRSR